MKTRITFVHEAEGDFEPSQASLSPDSLSINSLKGARQERITFDSSELPQEISQVLKQCHDLHVRWATERPYSTVPPFASKISPGLHVFYTPTTDASSGENLFQLLRKAFGDTLGYTSQEEAPFTLSPIIPTTPDSIRRRQFHQLVPSLEELVTFIQQTVCGQEDETCLAHASSILSAASLDLDYDNTSHALSITGYWPESPEKAGWSETIRKHGNAKNTIEVGILAQQDEFKRDELKLGGFLSTVGEDTQLKPTLFSFPSRHHALPNSSTYQASFPLPTGLHPTLKLSIPRTSLSLPSSIQDTTTCSLHTHLTLPSTIFADKYQLSMTDPLFLQSHNLLSLESIAGETDLEAPDWFTQNWGSTLLLKLATPDQSGNSQQTDKNDDPASSPDQWDITIPLHLRYLHPSPSGYRNISIPWPVIFWACSAQSEKKMSINPFDRTSLGWDDLFDPSTVFYHLHPLSLDSSLPLSSSTGPGNVGKQEAESSPLPLVETIQVPVLSTDYDSGGRAIQLGTVVVIFAGFLWILWKLGLVVKVFGIRKNISRQAEQGADKRKKQ